MIDIAQRIIDIAQSYVGEEEIKSNQGFKNPIFQKKILVMTPWYKGAPWCAAEAMVIWKEAYHDYPHYLALLNKYMSLNSQQMARNFHASAEFTTSSTTPVRGAIAIYGDGDSTTSGHTASAVIDINPDKIHYTTIEGNTIPEGTIGDDREGFISAIKYHALGQPHSQKGLNLIRFIYPLNPEGN